MTLSYRIVLTLMNFQRDMSASPPPSNSELSKYVTMAQLVVLLLGGVEHGSCRNRALRLPACHQEKEGHRERLWLGRLAMAAAQHTGEERAPREAVRHGEADMQLGRSP